MALSFDGISQYVDMGNPSILKITEGSWMIWFKVDPTSAWVRLLNKRLVQGDTNYCWGYWVQLTNNGYYQVGVGNNTTNYGYYKNGSTALDDGTVHHLAATFSNSDGLRAYVDGVEASGTLFGGSKPSTIGTNGESCLIAKAIEAGASSYGNGTMWDARIYNRVLSANEIAEIYHKRGADRVWHGLVGRWRMDGMPAETSVPPVLSLLDSMDSTSGWYYWGGFTAINVDSSVKIQGNGSIKPTKGTSSVSGTISRNITATDLSNKYIGIWMYIKDQDALNKFKSISCVRLFLQQTAAWAKYYYTYFDKTDLKAGEWFRLERSINDFSTYGSPPNKTINLILVGCDTNNASDTFASGDIFWDAYYYASGANSQFENDNNFKVLDLSGNGNPGTPMNSPIYKDSPHRLRRRVLIV